MMTFDNKDDVLTLLVHLGYLAFDQRKSEVFIPNKEIQDEFETAVRSCKWREVIGAIEQIRKKKYAEALSEYKGNMLLVGINYSKESKEHECRIERFCKE